MPPSTYDLTDAALLEGLMQHDERITRDFFYDTCQMAYHIYNKEYQMANFPGMDFYTLAHEYYLSLEVHHWRPLTDRPPQTSLRNWMIGGFRYVILDRFKQQTHEFNIDSLDFSVGADGKAPWDAIAADDYQQRVRNMVNEIISTQFAQDRYAQSILYGILVAGYKAKEVALDLGITPSAVSQRYHRLMDEVVKPYFRNYYDSSTEGIYAMPMCEDADSMVEHTMPNMASTMESGSMIHRMVLDNVTKIKEHTMVNPFWGKKQGKGSGSPSAPTPLLRITPHTTASELRAYMDAYPKTILIFGSNIYGLHLGGIARMAAQYYGAKEGIGRGLQGRTYAIPTMQGGIQSIAPYVDEFIAFAEAHPHLPFIVTRIGCGVAGFTPEEIGPLFEDARSLRNVLLPEDFVAAM